MYLQEQLAIQATDFLFCQTEVMMSQLSKHYNISINTIKLAPVPMNTILRYVDESMNSVKDLPFNWSEQRRILIYGRLQLVKGLHTVIEAAVQFLRDYVENDNIEIAQTVEMIEFFFVGPDIWADEHGMWTSYYLKQLIPDEYADRIVIKASPINRNELAKLSRSAYASIFASTFESLNLAAHEFARMGVPLILSDIPAFTEFFSNSSVAWFFETGRSDSLKQVLEKLLLTQEGSQFVQNTRSGGHQISYGDATEIYQKLYIPKPRRRESSAVIDLAKRITADYTSLD